MRIHLPKMLLLIIAFAFNFIISCNIFSSDLCSDDQLVGQSFSGKIKFEEYYSNGRMVFNMKFNDMGFTTSYDSCLYTEKFTFYENDDFSYIKIAHKDSENDTIEKLNGRFKTYKDKKYSWHILKLNSDSIYKKQIIIDTLEGSWYFSSNFQATKFLGFADSLLTDKRNLNSADTTWHVDSNCFNLSEKDFSDSNFCNDGYYLSNGSSFCLIATTTQSHSKP